MFASMAFGPCDLSSFTAAVVYMVHHICNMYKLRAFSMDDDPGKKLRAQLSGDRARWSIIGSCLL